MREFVSEPTPSPTIIPGTNSPPGMKRPAEIIMKKYQVDVKIKSAVQVLLMFVFIRALITPDSVLKKSVV